MKDIILSNGIRIILHQMLNTHSVTLGMYIKAGSGYETTEQQGITHLLEHLHFRRMGIMSQEQLYYKIESMGTNLKGITYSDFLQYSIKIHPVYFEDTVAMLKELIYTSEWTNEEFEKEKQVVINQIKENNKYFDMNAEVRRFIFRNTLLEKEIMGTVENISSFNLHDVQEYKKRIFNKNSICFCITGCVNDKKLEWLMNELESWDFPEEKAFEDCSIPQLFHQRGPDIIFYKSTSNIIDADVCFDISGDSGKDKLRNILNCILGEGTGANLQRRIREDLGYSSNIYSYIERYRNFEVLHISFSVEKEYFLSCLMEIVNVLKNLKIKITERELNVSLPFYTKNSIFLEDDTEEMNFQLAYRKFVLGRGTEEEIENIHDIAEELKKIAQEIFVLKNASIFIIGDTKRISKKSIKDILKKL